MRSPTRLWAELPLRRGRLSPSDRLMVGQYGERLEVRTTAQLPKADVPDPQPGDSLTIGATTYRIDQVTTTNNLFVEVVIR